MHPEHQRFWVSLLNLQRTWTHDEDALSFVPPRFRDFHATPSWPREKALAFLLNNLELVRESHRRLEAGELLDFEMLNHGLAGLTLKLHPWRSVQEAKAQARARLDLGGRLETLQVTTSHPDLNPGTRYVRATVERSLYYFAQYVDDRLSDPAYPGISEDRWQVVPSADGSGDLLLRAPGGETVLP